MVHKLEIEKIDDGRIIVSVNGYELDILADEDGLVASLQKAGVIHSELATDWDEPHINEEVQ